MRRRLSYANVMATLAFFFALTGASGAGAKFLRANDPINAGDLNGSTYGVPVIAAAAVTSEKIADGSISTSKFDSAALAPNANQLDGIDSRGFLGVNAKAADSDKLDGVDSADFTQGKGHAVTGFVRLPTGGGRASYSRDSGASASTAISIRSRFPS
jgi:hypothetical protein